MLKDKPSLHHFESLVREQLASSFAPDVIDPLLSEAESGNPAAEFIVAGALERAGEEIEAMSWYRRSAKKGYRPSMERIERDSAA